MVSVCLPSDALLPHLPSYLGFSYLWRGVSLHGCSSKAQLLLLTLDEGYLLTAALPDLQCVMAPLGPPAPIQPLLLGLLLPAFAPGLGRGVAPKAPAPDLRHEVAPPGCPWPWTWDGSSCPLPLASDAGWLLPAAPDLGHGVAPLGRSCAFAAWHSWPLTLTLDVANSKWKLWTCQTTIKL